MPATFSIRVLDSIIRIEIAGTRGSQAVEELREPWSALLVDPALPPDAIVQIVVGSPDLPYVPGRRRIGVPDSALAAQSLATAVTREGISRLHGRALLLHAAAIALDDRRVVGFVGPSGRGKTTASRALAQVYGYVTDETLAVLPDLSVIPYPKPLSVLDGPPPKHSIRPDVLGMRPAPAGALRLAAIALLDRRPGIRSPRVERVALTDGIGEVAPETSALVALPRPLGDLIDIMARTGGVRRVVYGEAAQLAAIVPEILDAASDSPPGAPVTPGAIDDEGSPTAAVVGGYRREPWVDAVHIDDRTVIHDGARVYVLDGLGPVLWSSADGATFDELVERAIRAVPPPPGLDAAAEVQRQLDTLTDAGVLRSG